MDDLVGVWVDQCDDLHSETKFLSFGGNGGSAARGWLKFKVLDPGIRETVLEVCQKLTQIMKEGRPANIENRRLVRKSWEEPDFGCDLAAELGDINFSFGAEAADGLDDPGIHIARGHAVFDG